MRVQVPKQHSTAALHLLEPFTVPYAMQEYETAKDILAQLVLHYSQPASRSLPATAAALETMGQAFMLLHDWPSARRTLEQCLAVGKSLCQVCDHCCCYAVPRKVPAACCTACCTPSCSKTCFCCS